MATSEKLVEFGGVRRKVGQDEDEYFLSFNSKEKGEPPFLTHLLYVMY